MKALALEIRQAAEESGWSIRHVCQEIGILQNQISQWENGITARPRTAKKVRKGLEQLGIPKSEGFTTRELTKVADGMLKESQEKSDDYLHDCILTIMHDMNEDTSYKIELIRFLLSK